MTGETTPIGSIHVSPRAVATIAGAAGGGFVFECHLILAPIPDRPSPS